MGTGLLIGVGLLVLALLLMAWVDVRTRPREPKRRSGHDDSGGLSSGYGSVGCGSDSSGY